MDQRFNEALNALRERTIREHQELLDKFLHSVEHEPDERKRMKLFDEFNHNQQERHVKFLHEIRRLDEHNDPHRREHYGCAVCGKEIKPMLGM